MDWSNLLGQVVTGATTVLSAKTDKPITNSVNPQPTNQLTPVAANAQAANAASNAVSPPSNISKYIPYIIIGSVVVLGGFVFLAARSSK